MHPSTGFARCEPLASHIYSQVPPQKTPTTQTYPPGTSA
jgi:hypothetical protein